MSSSPRTHSNESTHVMCIGSKVFTSHIHKSLFDDKDADESSTHVITIPSLIDIALSQVDASCVRSILRSFYAALISRQTLSSCHSINLHVIVPSPFMLKQKCLLLQEAAAADGNMSVNDIHSTATSLCVAAFTNNVPHTAPNILLTVEGPRGYCEWDPLPNGNKQRMDILAGHDGAMRVLVVEINRGTNETS